LIKNKPSDSEGFHLKLDNLIYDLILILLFSERVTLHGFISRVIITNYAVKVYSELWQFS